jgi:hypothetical protein
MTRGIELCQEPGGAAVGSEELHDGLEVDRSLLLVDRLALRAAVGEELFDLCFGDGFH